jgi:hypothetical protein
MEERKGLKTGDATRPKTRDRPVEKRASQVGSISPHVMSMRMKELSPPPAAQSNKRPSTQAATRNTGNRTLNAFRGYPSILTGVMAVSQQSPIAAGEHTVNPISFTPQSFQMHSQLYPVVSPPDASSSMEHTHDDASNT